MGLFSWAKRKTKDNIDQGKKVIGVEDIKQNADLIKRMSSQVLTPKSTIQNSKKETFADAKTRLGVTDADISMNYKNYVYSLYVSLAGAAVCFIGIIYYLFFSIKILAAISMLAVLMICMANSFRFSFRAFQIRHQKLCSVKEWWDRSGEWFPPLPKSNGDQ